MATPAAAPIPQVETPPIAAPGPAASGTTREKDTPSIPGKGERAVLALTPKKKRRHGDYATDSMPSLDFGRDVSKTAPAIQNQTRGLETSLFSGVKEATATNPREKTRTRARIMDRLEEINAKNRAKQDVIITAANAIDACLARYTTKHFLTAAELVRNALTAALENLLPSLDETTGDLKNPEKLGSQTKNAQPSKTASANTTRSLKDKSGGTADPTKPGAPGPTRKMDPKNAQVTWAQVASQDTTHNKNPHKDRKAQKNPDPNSERPAPAIKTQNKNKTASGDQKPDDRIFIRVPPDHDWRKMTAIGARQELISFMKLNSEDITYFQEVRSGFALRARNQETKTKIMALQPDAENIKLNIEEACTWKSFLIRGVSKTYRDMSGTHPTDALIPMEARDRAGAKALPVACTKAPFGETLDTCCYFVSFQEDVKSGFKLFNSSAPAELRVQKPRIIQCNRCLGFHNPRNCTRTERCLKCGQPTDKHKETTANCPSPPQCANCNGPHKADSLKCPARPVIKDGEKVHATKNQLKAIRELGQQEYNKAYPPKPPPAKEAPATDPTPSGPSKGGPRIRLPLSSSAPQPPTRPLAQTVTITVDTDEENSPMESSPARSAVHVAGSDTEEDEDMDEAPNEEDGPPETDL
jgi:hypothetical protein